jgi:hypothetical protein
VQGFRLDDVVIGVFFEQSDQKGEVVRPYDNLFDEVTIFFLLVFVFVLFDQSF